MAKQGDKFTLTEMKTLCTKKGDIWIGKTGNDYIKALSKLCNLKNKNDIPFTKKDINKQPTLDRFKFAGKNDYQYICELKGRHLKIENGKRVNEKIIAENFIDNKAKEIFEKQLGVSYIITCPNDTKTKEFIIKIGQTRTPFKKRLQSYNCGTVYNWTTASTTNKKILQSLVSTNLTYKLYLYVCNDNEQFTFHGIKSKPFASSKFLAVEDIMVNQFIKEFKTKPLANIQTNATEVENDDD